MAVLHWSVVSYDLVPSLSSLLMQRVKRAFDGTELFVSVLFCQREVCRPRVYFVWRDQFVVILVVTLLLNVVFNNSTIYGQK